MTHYLLILHAPEDLQNLILNELKKPINIDTEKLKKKGLCYCHKTAIPNIRELRIFEVDIHYGSEEEFERRIENFFAQPKHPNAISFLINQFLKFLGIKRKKQKFISWDKPSKGMMNARNFCLGKLYDELEPYRICPFCKNKLPEMWL